MPNAPQVTSGLPTEHQVEILRALDVERVQRITIAAGRIVLECTIPQERDGIPEQVFLSLQSFVASGQLLGVFLQILTLQLLLFPTLGRSHSIPSPVYIGPGTIRLDQRWAIGATITRLGDCR